MEEVKPEKSGASIYTKTLMWGLVALLLICAVALRLLTERKPIIQHYICPEGEYASLRCVYMNPLSSTMSLGDSGWIYSLSENSVRVVTRDGIGIAGADDPDWLWQEVDAESFSEFFGAFTSSMPDISRYGSRFFLELNDGLALVRMDGELWVMELHGNKKDSMSLVWSIYEIVPVEDIEIIGGGA